MRHNGDQALAADALKDVLESERKALQDQKAEHEVVLAKQAEALAASSAALVDIRQKLQGNATPSQPLGRSVVLS